MPYVLYSQVMGKYVERVAEYKIFYTADIDKAKVYKSKSGALNAVGETEGGEYGSRAKKSLPEHFDIIEVRVYQGRVEEVEEGMKEPVEYEWKQ